MSNGTNDINIKKKFYIKNPTYTNFFVFLIYLLPFSFFYTKGLAPSKIPYAYLLSFTFLIGYLSSYRNIKFQLNKSILFWFFLSIAFMTISILPQVAITF